MRGLNAFIDVPNLLHFIDGLKEPNALTRYGYAESLRILEKAFSTFDMRACLGLVRELKVALSFIPEEDEATWQEHKTGIGFSKPLTTLRDVVYTEMSQVKFLYIAPANALLYDAPSPFGEEVSRAFPSLAFDIYEAAMCLAVYRWTGCVLHLSRCVELSCRLLGKELGLPKDDYEVKAAGPLLRKVNEAIDARRDMQKGTAAALEEHAYLSDLSHRLNSAKDAWRNPSDHARAKYNADEARSIFEAVKSLMRTMAKRFRESPPPSAP